VKSWQAWHFVAICWPLCGSALARSGLTGSIAAGAGAADGSGAAPLRWGDAGARIGRVGRARVLDHALVAEAPSIAVGWFLLGSMRVERDLQYAGRQRAAFADGPFAIAEVERLVAALGALDSDERARHLALLHAGSVDELRARTRPAIVVRDEGEMRVGRVTQAALDGADTLVLELRVDPRLVRIRAAGDSIVLSARSSSASRVAPAGAAIALSTSVAYSDAASRTAWPPSASSWLTRPSGESLRSALAITNSDISGRHTGCIMSAVISMSRPK